MIKNDIIIIVSRKDQAGMNMLEFLRTGREYKEVKIDIPEDWPNGEYEYLKSPKTSILVIPESQIYTDYLKGYVDCKLMIFASKHSSAAGKKSLLVHTTGIWQEESGYGGNDHEVAYVPANLLSYAYDKIKEFQQERKLDYWTGIECTHHGPSALDVPIAYFETGGTETEWQDRLACKLIVDVIYDCIDTYLSEGIPEFTAFVGIGGNHYCSRFIKLLDQEDYGIGHIIPKYAIDELPEDMLAQAFEKTIAEEKIFILDKKGMRASDRDRFIDYIESNNWSWKFA